jgi:hypothetical protein
MTDRSLVATTASILIVLALAMTTTGSHEGRTDERIVQPYEMQVVTHIPIVAGYEPFPTPVHCAEDAGLAQTLVYAEDFEGAHGWRYLQTSLSPRAPNLWHVTGFEGYGESQPGARLYFGYSSGPSAGTFNIQEHVAGTAESPVISLPAEGVAQLSFTTKWHMEYLSGYDHMWVELLDEDGRIHLLCSNNSTARADGFGAFGSSLYSSCSPFLYSPCPALPPEGPDLIDLGYPGWETRHIEIPESLMGQDIRIRFTFDAADGAANGFLGWMVHDVSITTVAE